MTAVQSYALSQSNISFPSSAKNAGDTLGAGNINLDSREMSVLFMQGMNLIAGLQEQVKDLSASLTSVRNDLDAMQSKMHNLETENTTLKDELQQSNAYNADLAKQNTELMAEVNRLRQSPTDYQSNGQFEKIEQKFERGHSSEPALPTSSQSELPEVSPEPFPASGTADEKLAFIQESLKKPEFQGDKGIVASIANKYGNEHLIKAGGGHGNVLIIKGTQHVVKCNMEPVEKRRLEELFYFKKMHEALKSNEGPISDANAEKAREKVKKEFGELPQGCDAEAVPTERLAKMLRNFEHVNGATPVPTAIGEDANGKTYVVFDNANPNLAPKLADTLGVSVGELDAAQQSDSDQVDSAPTEIVNDQMNTPKKSGRILDLKMGDDTVSNEEQVAHGHYDKAKGSGWFLKKLKTRFLSWLKGTSSRGYEVVKDGGAGRFINGMRSETILKSELKSLTAEQRRDLFGQLESARIAHEVLPWAGVGMSAMLYLPSDETEKVGLKFGDLAHMIHESQIDESKTKADTKEIRDNLPKGKVDAQGTVRLDKYKKLKNGTDHGLLSIRNTLIETMKASGESIPATKKVL